MALEAWTLEYMKVDLTYYEITDYLRIHNNLELELAYVSPSTINVQTDVQKYLFKTHIDVDITLEKILETDLYLSYSLPFALKWIANKLLPHLHNKYPMIDVDNKMLVVHLNKIEQLKTALQMVELQDIVFSKDIVSLIMRVII